ncbi:hypothetical protein [Actinomadura monticuli]|uniref:Uncharacterized protein n=1 Tax=Actinomadura monticuli TaxID=3097367 RepID=A0ABV4QB97_9ACTN
MNRRSERTDAYAGFLGLAQADVRILRIALFRFAHGVPDDAEARRMIDEAGEIVVAFNEALARVEIVGSEEAPDKAKQVSEAAAQVGLRLSNSYLSGQPTELEAGTAAHRELRREVAEFAALCRRELSD